MDPLPWIIVLLSTEHTQRFTAIHYANAQRAEAPIEVAGKVTFLSKCTTDIIHVFEPGIKKARRSVPYKRAVLTGYCASR
jgi:hypothetical protein